MQKCWKTGNNGLKQMGRDGILFRYISRRKAFSPTEVLNASAADIPARGIA
jgi:hypothetical protein